MKVLPAFVDETGVLTDSTRLQPVYGIGLLLVHDPGKATEDFYQLYFNYGAEKGEQRARLRDEIRGGQRSPTLQELDRLMWSTRHHEYKFSEVTAFNLQHFIDLLNLYFSQDGIEFHALLVDRTEPGFSLAAWGHDPWRAYVEIGKELLERRITQPAFVIADYQGRPNVSSISVENFFGSAGQAVGCIRSSSEAQIFLQIVDVLLGCVQADLKDHNNFYASNSRRAQAKKELVDFMRTKLQIPSGQPIVSRQRRAWESGSLYPFSVLLK